MPINLGGYGWLAEVVIDMGFPLLAAAFHVPGPVSDFAAGKLKQLLGLKKSASNEELANAINEGDEASVKGAMAQAQSDTAAKYQFLTDITRAELDASVKGSHEVNQTMREEAGRIEWYHWRHLLGYLVLLYGLIQIAGIVSCFLLIIFGGRSADAVVAVFTALFNATTVFTAGLFALLGAVTYDNTRRVNAALGEPKPSPVIGPIIGKLIPTRKN